MTKTEQTRMLTLLDRLAESMEEQATVMREIACELAAFRKDLQDHERRIRKLESGKRRNAK